MITRRVAMLSAATAALGHALGHAFPGKGKDIHGAGDLPLADHLTGAVASEDQIGTSLKAAAEAGGRLYGAAARDTLFTDADYRAAFIRECSMLVCEGAMKIGTLRPAPGVFDFRKAEKYVEFARQNNMRVRGHTLVWHGSGRDWFFEALKGPQKWAFFETHVRTVSAQFAGKIHSWDVVNEPFLGNRFNRTGLRPTPFLEELGEEYIQRAFEFSHEADPHSKKVLNDFMFSWPDEAARKSRAALRMIERLLAKGTPVHAFGVQAHLFTHKRASRDIRLQFFREIRAMGLELYITELDVRAAKAPRSIVARDQSVVDCVSEYMDVVQEAGGYDLLLTWGLSDRYTWITEKYPRDDSSGVRPLPLDRDMRPKPLHDYLARILSEPA